nr:hypothetical protein [Tessaracoccus coleopterorum]
MSLGLFGTSVGLDQIEKFRVQSESATGLMVLSDHFPPGEAQPIYIVADSTGADDVVAAVSDVEGVVRAHPIGTTDDGSLTKIMVTSEYAPSSEESLNQITQLRDVAHAVEGRTRSWAGRSPPTSTPARATSATCCWSHRWCWRSPSSSCSSCCAPSSRPCCCSWSTSPAPSQPSGRVLG